MKQAVWFPTEEYKEKAFIWLDEIIGAMKIMKRFIISQSKKQLGFGEEAEKAVGYQWMKPYTEVLDLENGMPFAQWYNGGTCNVVESVLSRWLADDETRTQPALQYEGRKWNFKIIYI